MVSFLQQDHHHVCPPDLRRPCSKRGLPCRDPFTSDSRGPCLRAQKFPCHLQCTFDLRASVIKMLRLNSTTPANERSREKGSRLSPRCSGTTKERKRLADKTTIEDTGPSTTRADGESGRKAHGWRLECRAVNGEDSQRLKGIQGQLQFGSEVVAGLERRLTGRTGTCQD
jgi:hypothetical protein